MIWISYVSLRSLSLLIWITLCCYAPHLKERKRGRDDTEEHVRKLVPLWAGFGGQPRYMCVKCRRTYEWIFSHFISTVGRELPIAAHFVRWKMRSAHVSQHLMFLRIFLKSLMISAHVLMFLRVLRVLVLQCVSQHLMFLTSLCS